MSSSEARIRTGIGVVGVIVGIVVAVVGSVLAGIIIIVLSLLAVGMASAGVRRTSDLRRRR